MEINENVSKSMKNNRNPLKFRKYTKINENQWKSKKIYPDQRKSMEQENEPKSMNSWKSMKFETCIAVQDMVPAVTIVCTTDVKT